MRSFVILLTLVVCLLAQQEANGHSIGSNDVASQEVSLNDSKQLARGEIEATHDDEFDEDELIAELEKCNGPGLKIELERVILPGELIEFMDLVKLEFGRKHPGDYLNSIDPAVRADFSNQHAYPEQACQKYETEMLYMFDKVRDECHKPSKEVDETSMNKRLLGDKIIAMGICIGFSRKTTDCQQCSLLGNSHFCELCEMHNREINTDDQPIEHVPATHQFD